MYKIFLRGLDDVEVDDKLGAVIAEQYNNGTLPEKVVVDDGLSFESRAIKGVKKFSSFQGEDTKKQNTDNINRINAEFNAHMLACANWPIEKRAKELRYARLVWFAHTGEKDIDPAVVPEIEAEQLKYLEANPTTVFANPKCLQAIMKRHAKQPLTGRDFKTMAEAIRNNAMRIALDTYGSTLAYQPVENAT